MQVTLPLLLTSLSLDEPVAKHSSQTLFDNLLNFVSINAAPPQTQLLDQMTKPDEERDRGAQGRSASTFLDVSLGEFMYLVFILDYPLHVPYICDLSAILFKNWGVRLMRCSGL